MSSTLSLSTAGGSDLFYHEDVGGQVVRFRKSDSFGSLTDICSLHSKRPVKFLELPSTKEFIEALARKTGQRSENLTSAHQNGSYRGTWVHPLLLIEAARWCDAAFSVACSMVVLKVLSLQGKVHADGDVSLPINTAALEAGAASIPEQLPSGFLVTYERLAARTERLERREATFTGIIRSLILGQADDRKAALKQMERSVVLEKSLLNFLADDSRALPAPAAEPAAPAVSTAVPDPNLYNPEYPSQTRMRELIGERVRKYARDHGVGFMGVVWNDLYARFMEKTGLDLGKRRQRGPKKETKIAFIERQGHLLDLFEVSMSLAG